MFLRSELIDRFLISELKLRITFNRFVIRKESYSIIAIKDNSVSIDIRVLPKTTFLEMNSHNFLKAS